MSPEYNFHLKMNVADAQEASTLREFLMRVRGVESLEPVDQFKVGTTPGQSSVQNLIDLTTSVGQVVKAWREERGMNSTELAAKAGRPITKGYLSQLEHGKIQRPGANHLNNLAEALGISVDDILAHRIPDKIVATT